MKRILSLDISSSTIGFAVLDYDQTQATLYDHGHFKPPDKKKSGDLLPLRLEISMNKLKDWIKLYKPQEVVIEDYAKRFNQGKSTANIIILLSTFNECLRLVAYQQLGIDAIKYPVITIRTEVGKLFNTKIVSKDDIFPVIQEQCKSFTTLYNKKGNVKNESKDEGDAIAVGITRIIKDVGTNIEWKL